MTDTTFQAADDVDGSNKRTLVLMGGAAGVVILGAAGWFLLHGGSSSHNTAFTPPVHHATKQVATGKAPTAITNKAATLPNISTVSIGRDPFVALYVPQPAAAAGGTSTSTTSTASPTATASTSGTGTTSPSTPAVPTTYRLALLKVTGTGASRTAGFSVAGKTQYARVGSVFGRTSEVKLLSFQQSAKGVWSVTIQVGDDAPKDMSLNEVISVL